MGKNTLLIALAIIVLVGVGIALSYGFKQGSPAYGTPTPTAVATATSTPTGLHDGQPATASATADTSTSKQVTISNFAFAPNSITVKKGTKVTWMNQDSTAHTITGTNGGPDSAAFGSGASYSFTFNTVGTFPYHCSIHSSMTGTVIVTE